MLDRCHLNIATQLQHQHSFMGYGVSRPSLPPPRQLGHSMQLGQKDGATIRFLQPALAFGVGFLSTFVLTL